MFFASVLVVIRGPFSRILCKYLLNIQIVQNSQPVEKNGMLRHSLDTLDG